MQTNQHRANKALAGQFEKSGICFGDIEDEVKVIEV